MIKTFRNAATRKVFEGQKPNSLRGLDLELALRRLDILRSVRSLEEIPPLKSIGLHQLKGDREGQWAMRINGPWRLVFEWSEGAAHNVEITDYHKG